MEATRRIKKALSDSSLTVSESYSDPLNRQLSVTGQIARSDLEKLLDRNREGATMYDTPTISVSSR